jgi:Zn-dependent M28 family amino/carboxypeptidase
MAYLRALPTKRSMVGDAAHLQGLRDTQDLLVSTLTDLGYEPERWPFTIVPEEATFWKDRVPADEKDRAWENIVVKIKGTNAVDADRPEQVVLLGAHFDAVPHSPGADDDGTGTAALLELARVLKGREFKRSVRLVWFNGEEVGLIGSRKYAAAARRAMQEKRAEIVAMVSVEMLGYYSDEPDSQQSPIPRIEGVFEPPTIADFIALASTQKHAPLQHMVVDAMKAGAPDLKIVAPDFIPDLPFTPPDLLRSDHAPFLAIGVPAFLIGDTANFRSPHYHQPSDTVETIDPVRFTLCVRALASVVETLANADTLPTTRQEPSGASRRSSEHDATTNPEGK